MSALSSIRRPIEGDLEHYEEFVRKNLVADSQLLRTILDYILSNRGKGIRPLLVMLVAGMHARHAERGLGKRAMLAAMLVEMIHTASLVHDDVVDESDMRRGKPSVNACWQSRNAVLVGDFILAKSMILGLQSAQFDIVTHITGALAELCEGELIQSDQSERGEMTRKIYLDIIYKKTATLIGTSCSVGALAVGADRVKVSRMRRFGDFVGMAFQIRDDILDYTPHALTGKPAGNDLRERKITLPLLCVLERADPARRGELMGLLARASGDPQAVERLQREVAEQGGLDQAADAMHDYLRRAVEILGDYDDSPFRTSLVELCAYIASREE